MSLPKLLGSLKPQSVKLQQKDFGLPPASLSTDEMLALAIAGDKRSEMIDLVTDGEPVAVAGTKSSEMHDLDTNGELGPTAGDRGSARLHGADGASPRPVAFPVKSAWRRRGEESNARACLMPGDAQVPATSREEDESQDENDTAEAAKNTPVYDFSQSKNIPKNLLEFQAGSYDFRLLGRMTATFKPGPVGMRFHDETGMILDVHEDSQAQELGVKAGMTIYKIDGKRFSHDLLMAKVNGQGNYKVFFAFSLDKILSLHNNKEGMRTQWKL
jgi:hypothetical protein